MAQETQVRGYWTDLATGFMWAGKDNGKDVSWHNAVNYCRNLRLAGYPDWRLANMFELQRIYDSTANAPGLTGRHDDEPTTWHVKGNLFLTGNQWSSERRNDDRDILQVTRGTLTSTKDGQITSQAGSPIPHPSCVRCACAVPENRGPFPFVG